MRLKRGRTRAKVPKRGWNLRRYCLIYRKHISGEGLTIQKLRQDECRNVTYDYGLRASEEVSAIVKKRKLLG